MRNTTKNHQVADTKIFDDEDNNTDNREEEDKKESEDNIDVLTTDSYSYIVVIICMY